MNEAAEVEVITKLVKQIKESIDTCPAKRTETLAALKAELAVYEEFMPKQLDEDEIKCVICDVLDELEIINQTV